MSRKLDDLSTRLQPLVFQFIARCAEAGIPLMIIDTLRTPEEQAENIAKGASWTKNSKHLPQPPDMKSLAIDVAPYELWQLHGPDKLQWNASDPVWEHIARIGEACGLVAGYRWKVKDCGHFEYKSVTIPTRTA